MTLNAPQIIWFILVLLGIGHSAAMHGQAKPKTEYNVFVAISSSILAFAFLFWGGFFG